MYPSRTQDTHGTAARIHACQNQAKHALPHGPRRPSKHTLTLLRAYARAGLVPPAGRPVPGPLCELRVGIQLGLLNAWAGHPGPVVHVRGRRQHLAVRLPRPLFRGVIPGAPTRARGAARAAPEAPPAACLRHRAPRCPAGRIAQLLCHIRAGRGGLAQAGSQRETCKNPQLPPGKQCAPAAPSVRAEGGGGAQVLGHSKTILVLLGGWAFLGDRVSGRQAFGMALAVAGMVAYGVASSQCGPRHGGRRPPAAPAPRAAASARGPSMGANQHIGAAVPPALARRTSPRRRPA